MKPQSPGELFQIDHMSVTMVAGYPRSNTFKAFAQLLKWSSNRYIRVQQVESPNSFSNLLSKIYLLELNLFKLMGEANSRRTSNRPVNSLIYLFMFFHHDLQNIMVLLKGPMDQLGTNFIHFIRAIIIYFLRKALQKYVKKYNFYRPHQALQYLTPQQYYSKISGA